MSEGRASDTGVMSKFVIRAAHARNAGIAVPARDCPPRRTERQRSPATCRCGFFRVSSSSGRNPQLGQFQRVRDERHAQLVVHAAASTFSPVSIHSRSVGNANGRLRAPQEAGRQVVHAERHRVDGRQQAIRRQVGDADAGAVAVALRRQVQAANARDFRPLEFRLALDQQPAHDVRIDARAAIILADLADDEQIELLERQPCPSGRAPLRAAPARRPAGRRGRPLASGPSVPGRFPARPGRRRNGVFSSTTFAVSGSMSRRPRKPQR